VNDLRQLAAQLAKSSSSTDRALSHSLTRTLDRNETMERERADIRLGEAASLMKDRIAAIDISREELAQAVNDAAKNDAGVPAMIARRRELWGHRTMLVAKLELVEQALSIKTALPGPGQPSSV
jgi:hypothetical protein